jgi:MoxR-like ATPase
MGSTTATRGNLPAELTSFVGRRRQLQEIKAALSAAQLVTLIGTGGVGKTRLALRSAADLSRGIPDGCGSWSSPAWRMRSSSRRRS